MYIVWPPFYFQKTKHSDAPTEINDSKECQLTLEDGKVSRFYFSSCSSTFSKCSEENNYYFYNQKKNKRSLVTITSERLSMGMAQRSVLEKLSMWWIQMDKRGRGRCSERMWFQPQTSAPFPWVATLVLFLRVSHRGNCVDGDISPHSTQLLAPASTSPSLSVKRETAKLKKEK